jgi:pimeloyl-ACP methyl ester carboxylesterase
VNPYGLLEVAGARLEYRWIPPTRGGAPALVFLHEGLGCVSLWRDFPDRLAAATGLGALVYSRAGYAGSSPVPLPRPLDYMQREGREVLGPVMDAAGIAEAVLVGHSDGGSIALVHAGAADPRRRVRAVITEAPHVFCEELTVRSIEQARDAYVNGDLRARLARHHKENVDCAFWGWNQAWLDPGFLRWNIEEYLPGIRVPVQVIQGRDDPYGTEEQIRRIQRGVPGPVEAVLLDACGHSPHREQEHATLEAMVSFLARVVPPAP